tara:strand:- start:13 stop:150 length:138 start_codon:yes stop_codon:yes gene_type:complete
MNSLFLNIKSKTGTRKVNKIKYPREMRLAIRKIVKNTTKLLVHKR